MRPLYAAASVVNATISAVFLLVKEVTKEPLPKAVNATASSSVL